MKTEEGGGRGGHFECGPASTSVRPQFAAPARSNLFHCNDARKGGMGWPRTRPAEKMIRDPIFPRSISPFYHSTSPRPRPHSARLIVESHESSNVGRLTGPSDQVHVGSHTPERATKPSDRDPRPRPRRQPEAPLHFRVPNRFGNSCGAVINLVDSVQSSRRFNSRPSSPCNHAKGKSATHLSSPL